MPSEKQEYNECIQEMARSFQYMIDQNSNDTKIYDGVVVSISGGYTVKFNGKEHKMKQFGSGTVKVGSMVKVFIPQNNMNLAFFIELKNLESSVAIPFTDVFTVTSGCSISNGSCALSGKVLEVAAFVRLSGSFTSPSQLLTFKSNYNPQIQIGANVFIPVGNISAPYASMTTATLYRNNTGYMFYYTGTQPTGFYMHDTIIIR